MVFWGSFAFPLPTLLPHGRDWWPRDTYVFPSARASLQTGGRSEPTPVNQLVVPLFGVREETLLAVPGFLPDDRHTASLVGLRGGWRHARTKLYTRSYGSNAAVPGSLNSCRVVISETDLLCASETEILEELSDQGVIQVRRIQIKKDSSLFPTKHLTLAFNSPKLLSSIKAGYLNCKYDPTFRILCAALSARGSDTLKLPTEVN
ncbi:hypothetical protein TNCV_13041 [Trichonephila clavipes]|nr:hypothetical protein TNCV_13041 [Trichonephila clavipes]